jgi:uncharacterized Fe-S cluster protein YjdI/CDGSH-type Zn-finger protein
MSEHKRNQEYSNEHITVRFDPNVCQHSAVCIKNLPTVFDIHQKRWINIDGDSVENILALVKQCPSGALTAVLSQPMAAEPEPEPAEVVITVATNSALRIAGKVRIVDLEGNLIMETEKCSLCRCGLSAKKPFCDGAHKRAGWLGESQSITPTI